MSVKVSDKEVNECYKLLRENPSISPAFSATAKAQGQVPAAQNISRFCDLIASYSYEYAKNKATDNMNAYAEALSIAVTKKFHAEVLAKLGEKKFKMPIQPYLNLVSSSLDKLIQSPGNSTEGASVTSVSPKERGISS